MREHQPSEGHQPMIDKPILETNVTSNPDGTETRRSLPDTEIRSSHAGTVEHGHEAGSRSKLWSFNHNRYATRKTAAQGMMDMALMLANASQLKSVLQEGPTHRHFNMLVVLITLSICLQIFTGFILLIVGARESNFVDNDEKRNVRTSKLNNLSVAMVFLITMTNIFISSFGISVNTSDVSASGHGSGSVIGGGGVSDPMSVT